MMTEQEKMRLTQLYHQYFNDIEIGDKLGYHPTTIHRIRKSLGLKTKTARNVPRLDYEHIDAAIRESNGRTCAQIAEEFGCSAFSIRQRASKLGIKVLAVKDTQITLEFEW